jgi:hypothetical protein
VNGAGNWTAINNPPAAISQLTVAVQESVGALQTHAGVTIFVVTP